MDQSELLKQASQGYLQQGSQPSVNPLSNPQGYLNTPNPETGQPIPINQQSLADPNMPQVSGDMGPPPGPMYVAGVGFIGPDLGGAVKGAMMRQQYQMNANEDRRANEKLGMDKIKMTQDQDYLNIAKSTLGISLNKASMETKTFEQQQEIQQGMQMAAQQGGYTGVVEYLKAADPARAVLFQADKLKLDDMIMQNDVAKMAMPNMQTKVLFDSYKMGGQMASAILNAPEEQRSQLYAQMQPLIEKLIPGAPKTFDAKAQAMGMLMMAQATPENIMFSAKQQGAYAETQLGKLNLALADLNKKGMGNTPQAEQIQSQIASLDAKHKSVLLEGNSAEQEVLNKQLSGVQKQVQMSNQFSSNLRSASKPFIDNINTISGIYKFSQFVKNAALTGEDSSMAQSQLSMAMAAMANAGKAPTNQDYKAVQVATGLPLISKKVQSWATGKNVTLLPMEWKQAVALSEYMAQQYYKEQLDREEQWKQNADQFTILGADGQPTKVIDWNKLPKPSQDYINMINPKANKATMDKMGKEQIDQMVAEKLSSGKYDPQKLQEIKAQMYQQNGITQ